MAKISLSNAIDRLQSIVSKSDLGLWAAIKLRNQAEAVIGKRMSSGIRSDLNGETRLLEVVAPTARVVVDVGANVGSWFDRLHALAPTLQKAILVEPGKQAFARLTEKYSQVPMVLQIDKAASDYIGTAAFYELDDASELSSLIQTSEILAASKSVFDVEVTTIDKLTSELGLTRIDFLKIDSEGADMKVIRGARHCLDEQLIKFIQFEYNSSWAASGETLGGAIEFLNSRDYKVFLIKHDGLYDCCYRFVREYFRYSNYIAARANEAATVEKLFRGPIVRSQ